MMHAVWPMLSISLSEKIEAKNRQWSRLIHNWWDATNDEIRWLPNYQVAESKAQRFLWRFIDTLPRGRFNRYTVFVSG